ncbi:hypothetical protein POM88_048637 [Heracleum sosnowskyi]|uniref:Uncharacterized protein n=1 Tax=Heracleum sosnowskyi TaxID=360622 RepID=A0AAD8LZT1_9APIA|nr:hypothetical protein POM88_048637 [Heracleum sosnowskyi]
MDMDAEAEYRQVRVIGMAENVDKAEKLIKALIAFVDVGGSCLLFKDNDDNDCYDTRYDTFRQGERRSRSPGPYVRYSSSCSDDSSSDSDSSEYDSDRSPSPPLSPKSYRRWPSPSPSPKRPYRSLSTDRPNYDRLDIADACADMMAFLSLATPMAAVITDKVKDMQGRFGQLRELEAQSVR